MTESTSAILSGIRELGAAPDTYGTTLNTQISPAAADLIGKAVADAVRDLKPDHIAVWESSDEAVLAHVVALATGATVLRVTDESGIISVSPSITPGDRVVPLATAWEPRWLQAMLSVLRGAAAQVTAVAAVLHTPTLNATGPVPVVSLLSEAEASSAGLR
ncbi:hypothetical protein ACIQNG_36740 [Streptomyces sp. NPDC091377]|uniref:hypothetical protein n=1 Tax=Streptomyces sp. NPDC091377 TaxID=3365995 RepID=UPI0037FBA5D1